MLDMRVVPTAVSVSPQQEKEGPFPMHAQNLFFLPYQSSITFLHALLKCHLQDAGQDTAAALAKKPA